MRYSFLTNIILAIALLVNINTYAQETTGKAVNKTSLECGEQVMAGDCLVRNPKKSLSASIMRGKIAFGYYCTLCHGKNGQGDGRAARLHDPKPSNLTKSIFPPEYIAMIIRKGSEAMGRSKGMPPWGEQLTEEQIHDIVNHVISIRQPAQ